MKATIVFGRDVSDLVGTLYFAWEVEHRDFYEHIDLN